MNFGLNFIEKKIERINCLAYINRLPSKNEEIAKDRSFDQDIKLLRSNGTLVLDNFIPMDVLDFFQEHIKKKIEIECEFELPCLAQAKISGERHEEIIANKFKYSNSILDQKGVCFTKKDIRNYKQVLDEFNPSTLKILIEDRAGHFNLWLNPYLRRLVEAYMGKIPYMTEAYIRRNFPSAYKIMNHNWHRDQNHAHDLLKAFFFFTDCDIKHGPHEFIIGSHRDLILSGKDYYDEREVDAYCPPSSERRFISRVKAGTVILEDTLGLHRAQIPEEGHRDLGYAVFVPAPFWRQHAHPFYTISKETYNKLDQDQKKYIPKCGIV